jgi:hypothetical protein
VEWSADLAAEAAGKSGLRLSGSVRLRTAGRFHDGLALSDAATQSAFVKRTLGRYVEELTVEETAVTGLSAAAGEFSARVSFEPNTQAPDDSAGLFRVEVLKPVLGPWGAVLVPGGRMTPLELPHAFSERIEAAVSFPGSMGVFAPAPDTVSGAAGSVSVFSRVENGRWIFRRESVFPDRLVPADRYEGFREAAVRLEAEAGRTLVVSVPAAKKP